MEGFCHPRREPTTSATSTRKQATKSMRRAVEATPGAQCRATTRAPPDSAKRPVKQARTGKNPDFRALLQLSVRSPPTSLDAWRSRCSPGLFPLRGLPTQSLDSRPPLMCFPLGPDLPPKKQNKTDQRHSRVSIRSGLGTTPKTHPSLPEVCHLVRMPPNSLRFNPAS
jgi:hypothetical protein